MSLPQGTVTLYLACSLTAVWGDVQDHTCLLPRASAGMSSRSLTSLPTCRPGFPRPHSVAPSASNTHDVGVQALFDKVDEAVVVQRLGARRAIHGCTAKVTPLQSAAIRRFVWVGLQAFASASADRGLQLGGCLPPAAHSAERVTTKRRATCCASIQQQ